jgi:hypothetical protein
MKAHRLEDKAESMLFKCHIRRKASETTLPLFVGMISYGDDDVGGCTGSSEANGLDTGTKGLISSPTSQGTRLICE